jgi:hypothetical protein
LCAPPKFIHISRLDLAFKAKQAADKKAMKAAGEAMAGKKKAIKK